MESVLERPPQLPFPPRVAAELHIRFFAGLIFLLVILEKRIREIVRGSQTNLGFLTQSWSESILGNGNLLFGSLCSHT